MPNVIIFGDSRHPSLRHEVPVPLPDPIGYLEAEGSRTILAGSLDVPRLQALGDYEVVSFEELGLNELLAEGKPLRGRRPRLRRSGLRQARHRRGRRAG